MKNKIRENLTSYFRLSIAFLPLIVIIRGTEVIFLSMSISLPANTWALELTGILHDLVLFLSFSLFGFVIFFPLSLASLRVARAIHIFLLGILAILWVALDKYFSITLVPLDQVIFFYKIKEMVMVARSSTEISFMTWVPFIVVALSLAFFIWLFRKVPVRPWGLYVFGFLMLVSPWVRLVSGPDPSKFRVDFDYCLVENKPFYFLKKCTHFLVTKQHGGEEEGKSSMEDQSFLGDPEARATISRYQKENPGFTYAGPNYPLLRADSTPDVLGPFLNLGNQEPNLVFIIVESLGTMFMGDDPYYGSFMPFLDSLSKHSLYFNNFLATSERTFGVLPSMFASLPWGTGVFISKAYQIPYHFSLIRYAGDNGYATHFFYGGDTQIFGTWDFLAKQHTDHINTFFGSNYKLPELKSGDKEWGYADKDLFNRSFELLDSMKTMPRLDIYLTLTMHAPFDPPGLAGYQSQYDKRIMQLGWSGKKRREMKPFRNIFASIMYTDDALRQFFREYSKRPEFRNTIFFITGDHAMPELKTWMISPLEKYHVPLIVYSPMLKSPGHFTAVSSHLDITPSVLAMLKMKYGFRINPLAHWMGSGIDTSSTYRNVHKFSMVLNNKDIEDYIDGEYVLSANRVFKLAPGLRMDWVDDKNVLARLQQELKDDIYVTGLAATHNVVVPSMLYFGEGLQPHPLQINDSLQLSTEISNEEFVSALKKTAFDEEYKYINLDIDFSFKTDEDDRSRLPMLILEVHDSAWNLIVWHKLDITQKMEEKDFAGKWVSSGVRESIDLSFLHGLKNKTIKMYFWNPKRIRIGYDDLDRKITGYY